MRVKVVGWHYSLTFVCRMCMGGWGGEEDWVGWDRGGFG